MDLFTIFPVHWTLTKPLKSKQSAIKSISWIDENEIKIELIWCDLLTFHVPKPSCGINLPLFNVMLGTCDAIAFVLLNRLIYGKLLRTVRKNLHWIAESYSHNRHCSRWAINADWINSCTLRGYIYCQPARAQKCQFGETLK